MVGAPKKVVGYLRVSTDRQAEEGTGLDYQRRGIEVWAAANGVEVIAFFADEGISGSEPIEGRQGLFHAMGMLSRDYVDGIVVWKLDRLARDVVLQEVLYRDIVLKGGELYSTFSSENDTLRDPQDPTQEMVRVILGAVAQLERKMLKARSMAGKAEKRAQGGYIGGRTPFGQRASGVRGQLEPDPEQMETIEMMVDLRKKGFGYERIARELDKRGRPTQRGGPWTRVSVRDILNRVSPSLVASYRGPKIGDPGKKPTHRSKAARRAREKARAKVLEEKEAS